MFAFTDEEEKTTVEEEMHCARHPKEITGVTCATCGTPICPRCMVVTPVGMKCRDCGTNKHSVLHKVRPERLLLAGLTSLAAGAVASAIGELGFFVIFLSFAYGYFAGSMILKASGMKRGPKLEIVAGAGMVIGAVAAKLVPVIISLLANPSRNVLSLGLASLSDLFFWAAVVISTSCAISKMRYL